MPNIEFKYEMDGRVVTPFGDNGIIDMLGFDEGGKKYHVKTKLTCDWFKEDELSIMRDMQELTEAG